MKEAGGAQTADGGRRLGEFVAEIHRQIEELEAELGPRREEDRMKYRKRFGIRGAKDYPFPNCANFSLRLADKIIRKVKPHYMALVAGVEGEKADVLSVGGDSGGANAEKSRALMNDILNRQLRDYEPLMWVAVDKALMYDYAVIGAYWLRRVQKRMVEIDLRGWKDEWTRYAESAALKIPAAAPAVEEWLALKIHAAFGVTLDPEDEHEGAQIRLAAEALAAGRESVSLGYDDVEEDRNAIRVIEPADFVVARHVKHLQSAELICEKMAVSRAEFEELVHEGKFDECAAREILERRRAADGREARFVRESSQQGTAAGGDGSGLIALRKVCCYYRPEGEETYSRHVLYYCPDMPGRALSLVRWEREHWPYAQIKIEVTDEGFYSPRGIVTLVDTFDRIINTQFNDMMNRRLITTTPMLTHVPTKVYPSNIRYIPGQSIPVKEQGAIQPLQVGMSADVQYERGILFIRAWAEDFMGVPDYAMKNEASSHGAARTASEIRMVAGLKDVLFEMDARVFNRGLEELFGLLYEDWRENAGGRTELEIDGRRTAVDPREMPPEVRFRAVATFSKVDRDFQREQALRRLALYRGDPFIDQYQLRRQALMMEGDGLAHLLLVKSQADNGEQKP